LENFAPSAFLDLNQGKGPLARALGVEGKPGKYNVLEYLLPKIMGSGMSGPGGTSWMMTPAIAQSLYDYGFKTKADVGKWMGTVTWTTVGEFRKTGWYDFTTSGQVGGAIDPVTGKLWRELPDDTRKSGTSASILVVPAAAGYEFLIGYGGGGTVHLIDPWR
jgi:hypothetical protein